MTRQHLPDQMTSDQAKELLSRLYEFWPNHTLSPALEAKYVQVIQKFELDDMAFAIEEAVEVCRYFPTIAELCELCDEPIVSRRMTKDELKWSGHNPRDFSESFLPEGWEDDLEQSQNPLRGDESENTGEDTQGGENGPEK